MDVDLTIRYSDDRLCEIIACGRTPQRRFIGLPLAVQTSARASPRQCRKHAASSKSPFGRIGGALMLDPGQRRRAEDKPKFQVVQGFR